MWAYVVNKIYTKNWIDHVTEAFSFSTIRELVI